MFKVTDVPGASGYLWGFFQDDRMVWENLGNTGKLNGPEYAIHPDDVAHGLFHPGPVVVMVRAQVNQNWTEAAVITIHLEITQSDPDPDPYPIPPSQLQRPQFIYPLHGQVLGYDGSYMFKVTDVPGASGYLWGFFQDDRMVWENLGNTGKLDGPEYAIHPDNPAHNLFHPGPVTVMVRGQVNNQWTEAAVITISLE
ncbi:MAG: hypothetical protein HC837_16150 [Chloroflexaceae bacterium]|nr:hypothetical protein [Chloroflexaceae bacterium]